MLRKNIGIRAKNERLKENRTHAKAQRRKGVKQKNNFGKKWGPPIKGREKIGTPSEPNTFTIPSLAMLWVNIKD